MSLNPFIGVIVATAALLGAYLRIRFDQLLAEVRSIRSEIADLGAQLPYEVEEAMRRAHAKGYVAGVRRRLGERGGLHTVDPRDD